MKTLITVLLVLILFLLSACASTEAVTTIVQEGGKTITTLSGAAVQRDVIYSNKRQHRDTLTKEMYNLSGINLTFERYTYTSPDGSFTFTANDIKTMTVRAPHTWMQKIADTPPDHRGWATADKALGIVGNGVLGYFLNQIIGTANQEVGTKYYGDYNPQTATPYIVEPTIIQ